MRTDTTTFTYQFDAHVWAYINYELGMVTLLEVIGESL